MSNLDKVMNKLNSQKSVEKVKEVEEVKEVLEIEEPIKEEEEDNEDENGEEPVTEKPKLLKEESNKEKLSQQRAEEIQILQNNGVYRVETLFQLGQLNKNIVDLNTLIAGVIENAKK